jgi:hypothetical protein
LIALLEKISTPWEFEISGSQILNESGKLVIGAFVPPMEYPDMSSLSPKWKGIRVRENNQSDIEEMSKIELFGEMMLV